MDKCRNLFTDQNVFIALNVWLIIMGNVYITIETRVMSEESDIMLEHCFIPPIFLVIGVIMIGNAFFGIFLISAKKKKLCLIYIGFTAIFILLHLGLIIFSFTEGNKVKEEWQTDIGEKFQLYYSDPVVQDYYLELQHLYHCCGNVGPSDFKQEDMPSACCHRNNRDICKQHLQIFTGCANAVWKHFNTFMYGVMLLYVVNGIFEILLVGLAFYLYSKDDFWPADQQKAAAAAAKAKEEQAKADAKDDDKKKKKDKKKKEKK